MENPFSWERLFRQKAAFPGGGRWHGKAVTDEVAMDPKPSPKTFGVFLFLLKKEAFPKFGKASLTFAKQTHH